jgi:hypothetical protein
MIFKNAFVKLCGMPNRVCFAKTSLIALADLEIFKIPCSAYRKHPEAFIFVV